MEMAYSGHKPDQFRWKRFTKNKKTSCKVQRDDDDVAQWVKRVEMASELAVSEVFSRKRRPVDRRLSSSALTLQTEEQLQDHDEAYGEAQLLLSDWMNRKLRVELEAGQDEETDSSEAPPPQPAFLQLDNFDDLYSHLDQDTEHSAVHSVLQDLMLTEVVDSGIVEDLGLDAERKKKKWKNPQVTMEMRHQQVRESRARREAEREHQRREREMRREAREEAQRQEQELQRRRRQEARQQEELLQQEVVRLRRKMEEQRRLEQRIRAIERERQNRKPEVQALPPPDPGPALAEPGSALMKPGPALTSTQQLQARDRLHKLQQIKARVHLLSNLRCVQKCLSGWSCVVLERRVQMGKAAALCDWRTQLRAWRAWRSVVWANRVQREAERTEEELRTENRRQQVALGSDRRRLLRRSLSDWRLWCQRERRRRELLSQQEETQRKMAALLHAAASGRLGPSSTPPTPCIPHSTESSQPQIAQQGAESVSAASSAGRSEGDVPLVAMPTLATPMLTMPPPATPTLAWQVTRRHAVLGSEELRRVRRDLGAPQRPATAERRGEEEQQRREEEQQRREEQRRREKEQQRREAEQQRREEQWRREKEQQQREEQRREEEQQRQSAALPSTQVCHRPAQQGAVAAHAVPTMPLALPARPHRLVTAMEERARQRAERRREVEEMKRRKEEERQALMKAVLEQRQREEEEERRMESERRKEEKRLQRERELEKQRRVEQVQLLRVRALEHYHRTLLQHRGLAPWKRLIQQSRTHSQLARDHQRRSLLRRCLLAWLHAAGESLAEKEACAAHLYQHILLRRSLHCWQKLKELAVVQQEQARRFCRTHSLQRAFTALLDHVTQERFAAWDKEQQAHEHHHRWAVTRCFRAWQRLPRLQREERAREERREQLRRRVAEILPDFRCPRFSQSRAEFHLPLLSKGAKATQTSPDGRASVGRGGAGQGRVGSCCGTAVRWGEEGSSRDQ
ncbi:coiled-coil domain-containing protein 191 [Megalops cyprinoides]|uniref:coiled-coil domain-containing protein 191 n=1 Tax=Megalops cyprinoides TaxID=118141 RepID=UPI00186559FB|nr:coiled-coil domain-containing protein 191 [Megalops cyprinoides]